MKKIESANEANLTFSYLELLALNKLLGKVNGEIALTAEALHSFTMSPIIATAYEKIHKAYMDGSRKELARKNIPYVPKEVADRLDGNRDFQLKKYGPFTLAKKRFQQTMYSVFKGK